MTSRWDRRWWQNISILSRHPVLQTASCPSNASCCEPSISSPRGHAEFEMKNTLTRAYKVPGRNSLSDELGMTRKCFMSHIMSYWRHWRFILLNIKKKWNKWNGINPGNNLLEIVTNLFSKHGYTADDTEQGSDVFIRESDEELWGRVAPSWNAPQGARLTFYESQRRVHGLKGQRKGWWWRRRRVENSFHAFHVRRIFSHREDGVNVIWKFEENWKRSQNVLKLFLRILFLLKEFSN